jgi:aminocarboxymuconate-semialdehyde decarboxylase
MTIIDCHTHTLCPAVNDKVGPLMRPDLVPYQRDMTPESKSVDQAQGPVLGPKFNDIATRRAEMSRMRTDKAGVLPAPGQQHYWAPADLLREISRMQNDHVAKVVATFPQGLFGMGTLPMTDVAASTAEASRAVEVLGLKGFQIDSRVLDRELSDPSFDPLYAHLARLNAPLIIHPLGFSHGHRLGAFFMVNTVGQPLEEIIAINHLVFGGVLDRHPALKVLIVHGGGYFPFYLGRMDHAWAHRPELKRLTSKRPSDYLRSMWYDTCVFAPEQIRHLVDVAGADRVMLGSDYPFDMGDPDPLATVDAAGLSSEERADVCSHTAHAFFGL